MAENGTPTAIIEYAGNNLFTGKSPSGHSFSLDSDHERNAGPTPVELLMIAVGSCTAIDVVSILEKKRQKVFNYRVEVTGERNEEHPRYFKKFFVKHIISGHNIEETAVRRAIELSDEKYCSVAATVKPKAEVITCFEIIETADEPVRER